MNKRPGKAAVETMSDPKKSWLEEMLESEAVQKKIQEFKDSLGPHYAPSLIFDFDHGDADSARGREQGAGRRGWFRRPVRRPLPVGPSVSSRRASSPA